MPKGYGYGLGEFSNPLAPFVDFYGHQNIPFLLYYENWMFLHELDELNSTLRLALCQVELEDSRTFRQVGELLHYEGGWV